MPKTVLFATFSLWLKDKRTPINGMIEPLLTYLNSEKIETDLIDGLHPGSSNVITFFEHHVKGRITSSRSWVSLLLWPLLKLQNANSTQFLFKIRDFFSVLELALRKKGRYDVFIGLESMYTLSGILLRKLGRVKMVVYYVSDYSPKRYDNKTINNFYLWMDRYCCYNADYVWDVSKAFHPARISSGLNASRSRPVIHVPNALFPGQICPLPISKRIPFALVYAGTLTLWNGPDIAVEAIASVKKKFPKTTLHMYGTNGKDQARVKKLIGKLKLDDAVIFHGFVGNVIELSHSINRYQLGLAPYGGLKGSHRAYGDATKLRLYMGAGLPIITTPIPPLGREVADFGAGLICQDNAKELAQTIMKVFRDASFHLKLVQKANEFAKNNTWKNTYDTAFRLMDSV